MPENRRMKKLVGLERYRSKEEQPSLTVSTQGLQ
jgi:hypothetical protein